MQFEAFFIQSGAAEKSQRLYIFYPSQQTVVRGLVLYIHPLADEMNKTRRMAALQARALAEAGFSVLQIDLLGCGDSAGDFGDATWQHWVDDVVQAHHWLRKKSPAPVWLWGLRGGCLLAVEAAQRLNDNCHFLFWQPASSGKLLLQQFLRLKLAGDLLDGQGKGVMQAMRQQLAQGQSVEIAGYNLSGGLAQGLELATLAPPQPSGAAGRVAWFEISARAQTCLSPGALQSIAQWQAAGFNTQGQLVHGPAFWQSHDIEEIPDLIKATTEVIAAMSL